MPFSEKKNKTKQNQWENRWCQEIYENVLIYRKTFSTRIVAGELTTDSLRFGPTTGGSSRGLLDADVAIANAAAAVDVLLLLISVAKN